METIIATVVGLVIGGLLGWLVAHRRTIDLAADNARLAAEVEAERRAACARNEAMEEARKQLSDGFAALAGEALRHNSESFLKLAQENLNTFQERARAELGAKEKSFESLVQPIRETLEKTGVQIREMEKSRATAFSALHQNLKEIGEGHLRLQSETHNLVRALSRPTVRGQWGELTLKRLAELAGMVEHCDFVEQVHRATEDGAMRPDMLVKMPDGRELVVDAKTPLDAYLMAVNATDDKGREEQLRLHARKVRERMRELASKAYWSQFRQSPDFVILFIPGDQFLSAALEYDPALLEDSLANKVVLTTPSSLVALLRAVAFGWRQEAAAENAEKIRDLGEELYKRVATLTEHLNRLGKSLGGSVDHYNALVGSLERQFLPQARRFAELGIESRKEIPATEPLDHQPRAPNLPE